MNLNKDILGIANNWDKEVYFIKKDEAVKITQNFSKFSVENVNMIYSRAKKVNDSIKAKKIKKEIVAGAEITLLVDFFNLPWSKNIEIYFKHFDNWTHSCIQVNVVFLIYKNM